MSVEPVITPCAGAGLVEGDVFLNCQNAALTRRHFTMGGWAVEVPLCGPHLELWNDATAGQMSVPVTFRPVR